MIAVYIFQKNRGFKLSILLKIFIVSQMNFISCSFQLHTKLNKEAIKLSSEEKNLLFFKLIVPKNGQPLMSRLCCQTICITSQRLKNLFKWNVLLQIQEAQNIPNPKQK